jgi:hypothetical protein
MRINKSKECIHHITVKYICFFEFLHKKQDILKHLTIGSKQKLILKPREGIFVLPFLFCLVFVKKFKQF